MIRRVTKDHKQVKYALEILKLKEPSMKTQIVGSSAILPCTNSQQTMQELYKLFQRLDLWKEWSVPLHASAQYSDDNSKTLSVGTKFTQTLNLGFPVGQQVSNEQVAVNEISENHAKIMWNKEEGGIAACHLWSFECLDSEKLEVTNVEVFHGMPIFLVKGLVSNRWNDLFEKSLSGFLDYYRKSQSL
ncbi:predicted protein [Naegleria gruberi]|uniref:Predicted protein n=1 Tax=Naegleria gruberi TaxID=5762 RepID=D2VL26_NAEGR|nr:uncharacterized protein NAEGRDRAFT_69638 [Naegleria gruberi]EFC42549.1 predicted protein [Naegleria gruberi]|eukprot:XP_002675293.1 predicted protein [Naegleria gruberi strain NEG-M]